jgi:pyruvoyl-dependent arginine decarboxylase (PvlArgDC)
LALLQLPFSSPLTVPLPPPLPVVMVQVCPPPPPGGLLSVVLTLANATPENDIVSANISAAINNEMRLRIGFLSSLIVFHPIASPR